MSVEQSFTLSSKNVLRLYAAFSGTEVYYGYRPKDIEWGRKQFFTEGMSLSKPPEHQIAMAMIEVFRRLAESSSQQKLPTLSVEEVPKATIKFKPSVVTRIYAVCAGIADPKTNKPLSLSDAQEKFIKESVAKEPSPEHLIAIAAMTIFSRFLEADKSGKLPQFKQVRDNVVRLLTNDKAPEVTL
jgi:hypothetical protein